MEDTSRNLLVGLFVVASLAVLGLLMVWFGETPVWLGRAEWTLRIVGVSDLSGIEEGSPVTLSGVQIGRVKVIEFEDSQRPDHGVRIVTRIKRDFSVPNTASAKVYGAMLGLGMGHVAIVVGPGLKVTPLPTDGTAMIRGEMHSIVRELIRQDLVDSVERTIRHIGDLAASARPVADNLAKLIEQRTVADTMRPGAAERGFTPNLATAIERIDNLLANVNAVLGDESVQGDVKEAVGDLKAATEELRATIALWKTESQRIADNFNAGIDQTEEHLGQSFARLNELLGNLDSAATNVADIMREVAAGRGTAGLLARDERLYEAGVISLERLSELIATLQRIATKIEDDGYFTVGKQTPVGTFTKAFPVGATSTPEPEAR